jgi:predicted nucleotide-binding protein (sugar kinase/HSP70/actin superfamily)
LGFKEVPIYSPNMSISFYSDLGLAGNKFVRQASQGMVAVDMLEKCLHEIRPYEVCPGETDRIYREFLRRVCQTLRKSGDILPDLEAAREAFAKIRIERDKPRPLIGIVGEIFVRSNRFSNENVVRKIEELGGEAWLPPFSEWVIYTNYIRYRESLEEKKPKDFLLNFLIDTIQTRDLHRLERPFRKFLRNFHEPSMKQIEAWAVPFINITFRGEGVLGFGKSVDFIHKGASGMVNVMPFTCMPGTVFTSLIKKFRQEYNEIPFISLAYDGLDHSNNQIRLEAFMHQCAEYMKQQNPVGKRSG